jgi:hypothetical protein
MNRFFLRFRVEEPHDACLMNSDSPLELTSLQPSITYGYPERFITGFAYCESMMARLSLFIAVILCKMEPK